MRAYYVLTMRTLRVPFASSEAQCAFSMPLASGMARASSFAAAAWRRAP